MNNFVLSMKITADGAQVIAAARDDAKLQAAAASVGTRVLGLSCDVTDEAAVVRLFAEVARRYDGQLDLLAGGKAILLTALCGRLYYLQVVEADRYATLADENRINLRLLAPPRGRIIDRFGAEVAPQRARACSCFSHHTRWFFTDSFPAVSRGHSRAAAFCSTSSAMEGSFWIAWQRSRFFCSSVSTESTGPSSRLLPSSKLTPPSSPSIRSGAQPHV